MNTGHGEWDVKVVPLSTYVAKIIGVCDSYLMSMIICEPFFYSCSVYFRASPFTRKCDRNDARAIDIAAIKNICYFMQFKKLRYGVLRVQSIRLRFIDEHINMLFLSIPQWIGRTTHGAPCFSVCVWVCVWPIEQDIAQTWCWYVDCIEKDTVNPIKFNVDISISVFQLIYRLFSFAPVLSFQFICSAHGRLSGTDVALRPFTDAHRTPILSAQQNCRVVESVGCHHLTNDTSQLSVIAEQIAAIEVESNTKNIPLLRLRIKIASQTKAEKNFFFRNKSIDCWWQIEACVCVAMLSVIQSHNIVFVQYVFVMQFNGLPWQKISIGISSTYSTLSWISIGPFHWCAQMRLIAHNSLKRIVWVSLVCKTLPKPNRCKFPGLLLNSYLFYRLIKRFESYHLSVDRFRSITNTPSIEIFRRMKVENVEAHRKSENELECKHCE